MVKQSHKKLNSQIQRKEFPAHFWGAAGREKNNLLSADASQSLTRDSHIAKGIYHYHILIYA